MMNLSRRICKVASAVALAVGFMLAAPAQADSGIVKLNSFPSISVADGRSTVTISAEIRDTNGSLAPNGTQVVFSATLGCTFREPVVKTQNGIAHAILEAGSIPGTVRITATALAYNATTSLDYELVSDRSLLSTAKEFVEIVADTKLLYS
ncbi:MAG TPA: Ig-like domain-containing protein, partial [Fimbriimonadaceae bacterium]|nr:Ig-like domain-containing protein [Fimbriimonadaceae bacterium]